ncbi:dipeptide epimerase [Novosphingobium sp. ZN18A2]|uniref:dipeptide epimerase n=1 Tax=Novosphingobium sp. ZN18A2 TaxID=3079861 RepID=UPI0030D55F78
MTLAVSARVERFDAAGAFVISRGAKTHVDVVTCTIVASDGARGEGEGTPVYYRGESAAQCVAAIERWAAAGAHEDRARLQRELPAGAARNAVDCALWNLAAARAGVTLAELAGQPAPAPVQTAMTVSLGAPAAMAQAASAAARDGFVLLKAKLAGDGQDEARVSAIRDAAPGARLIVDANEAFAARDLVADLRGFAAAGVEMVEQPLPAGEDRALEGMEPAIPLCADESCQTAADLPRLATRYQAVNIKLDKCGGLTAALALASAARARGMDLMLGCMLSTSLAIRPALVLAGQARWIDLDGPLLIARDRPGGLRYDGGTIFPD